jgi:hypothetical protein
MGWGPLRRRAVVPGGVHDAGLPGRRYKRRPEGVRARSGSLER